MSLYEYLLIEKLPKSRADESELMWPPEGTTRRRKFNGSWEVEHVEPKPHMVHARGTAGACFDARRGDPNKRVVARKVER